jgi:hypothetical protein
MNWNDEVILKAFLQSNLSTYFQCVVFFSVHNSMHAEGRKEGMNQ